MNTNAYAKKFLEEMALKAGLRAKVLDNGMSALWTYKDKPFVIASLTVIEANEDKKALIKRNSEIIAKASALGGSAAAELLRGIIMSRPQFEITFQRFEDIPPEVVSKIEERIRAEDTATPHTRESRPIRKSVVLKKAGHRPKPSKAIQDFLVAS